jgi:hypothetical protein
VFSPESVELPDRWPACRRDRCGSTAGVAHVETPHGPIVVTCENGHHRAYAKPDDFRRGGPHAGAFSSDAVPPEPPRDVRLQRLEPGARRRGEVLEDADRCALCGTPPAEHPYRPDLDVRGDAAVLAWFQRRRPAVYAQILEALAIVRRRERVTLGDWRLKLPPALREVVVGELRNSALVSDHLVAPARLERLVDVLTQRELEFAANRLLVAVCRRCAAGRRGVRASREQYLRHYVVALHGGDERLARADAARWRMMENVALHAARVVLPGDEPAMRAARTA